MFSLIDKLFFGMWWILKTVFTIDREAPLVVDLILRGRVPLRKLICYTGIINVIMCIGLIILLCLCPGYITASEWGEEDDFVKMDVVSGFFHAAIMNAVCSIIVALIFVYEAYKSKIEWTKRLLIFGYANGFAMGPTYVIFTLILYFYPIRRNGEMHKYILEVVISSVMNMIFLQVVDHFMAEEEEKMYEEEEKIKAEKDKIKGEEDKINGEKDKINTEEDKSSTIQQNTTSDDVSKNPEMSIRKRQRDNDTEESCITES
ncbi:uncharacterized protein [Chelonus insularis]|uniref:uncharacterized protein n=1 Tax=Chelonus insularis TaxID=460826 RepID=UPI00158B9719|nr:uncharacterized protein LOC118071492 [Chelonus insularis]